MMPKTYFSAPLSKSAKDTESRIRNIFEGRRRRPAVLALVLVAAVALLCGSVIAVRTREAAGNHQTEIESGIRFDPAYTYYYTDSERVSALRGFLLSDRDVHTFDLEDRNTKWITVSYWKERITGNDVNGWCADAYDEDSGMMRHLYIPLTGETMERLGALGLKADEVIVYDAPGDSPRESLLRALRGELAFPLDTSQTRSYELDHEVTLTELTADDSETMERAAYTFIDLNGDGTDEAVWRRGDYRGFIILHVWEGKVYGYEFNYRGLMQLKQDGTFAQSAGAGDNGYGRLFFQGDDLAVQDFMRLLENGTWSSYTIEGREVSRDEYFRAMEAQDAKPDAEWSAFAPRVEQPAQRLKFGAPDYGELPEPMEPLAGWQKELLADLPALELPRQAVELGGAFRGDFWRDTLIPFAYDEPEDVTLYGVVAASDLEGWGDRIVVETSGATSDGIVLRAGGRAAYFPTAWYGNMHYSGNPWMAVADFDGDGAAEAAVCLLVGTGTGVSTSFLHVIDLDTLERHTVDISTLDVRYSYGPSMRTVTVSAGGLILLCN